VLGLLVNAFFTITDLILIETAHAVALQVRRSKAAVRWLRQLAGFALVSLGVKLALAHPG
jgi:threonine/homoserine/homoserine lactone efflux protein